MPYRFIFHFYDRLLLLKIERWLSWPYSFSFFTACIAGSCAVMLWSLINGVVIRCHGFFFFLKSSFLAKKSVKSWTTEKRQLTNTTANRVNYRLNRLLSCKTKPLNEWNIKPITASGKPVVWDFPKKKKKNLRTSQKW